MSGASRLIRRAARLGLALAGLWLLLPVAAAQESAAEWNESGVAALEAGRLDDAVEAFQAAHGLAPDDLVVRRNLARAFGHRAASRFEAGRLQEALADLDRGRGYDRDGGALEVLAARIRLASGERTEARRIVEKVRADFPENLEAARLAADLLAVAGEVDAAVALLQRAHDRFPGDAATAARLNQLKEEQTAWNGFLTDSSAHFDYRFDPRRPAIVQAVPMLRDDLEDAYQAVVSRLTLEPGGRILVIVLDRERYQGAAPRWSGGLYDGRIRLAVGDYGSERAAMRTTLRHEYTHAALHRLGPRLPTWFHEGLAQWVEGRPVEPARARLRRAGAWPELAALQGDWTRWTDPEQVLAAYDYALSLSAWIQAEFGSNAWQLLFGRIRRTGFEAAFPSALGRSLAGMDAAHRAFLRERG